MVRSLLLLLTLCFAVTAPVAAEYDHGALQHCGAWSIDAQGWLRVTCAYEIAPMGVVTVYVWFPRDLADTERVDWQVNGAATPLIVNPIRANPIETKRDYLKFRIMNPAWDEQYVTMTWLVPQGHRPPFWPPR